MLACFLSPVFRIGGLVRGNHGFVFIAYRKQLVLGHDVLATLFHVVFMDPRFDNRIDRTGFLAKTAINALEKINVITRGSARAIFTHVRFNRYRKGWADRLAQFTGDTPFLAVRITPERM
jgi:hypothetical protein